MLGGHAASHAQGNIYNDTADGQFKFTAADDDTVTGTAHIRMSHAPATMPGGCIFTRSQDPEEFDVTIDGRRNADRFELNFGTALATYTITTKCQGHSGTGSVPGMDAFMGGSDVVLRDSPLHGGPAKVPAEGWQHDTPWLLRRREPGHRHDPDHMQARVHPAARGRLKP